MRQKSKPFKEETIGMLVRKKKEKESIEMEIQWRKEKREGGGEEGGRGQKEVDPPSLSPWSTDSSPIKTRLAMPPNLPPPPLSNEKKKRK